MLRSTATPRACASRSAASSALCSVPLPVAATTMPSTPASHAARRRRGRRRRRRWSRSRPTATRAGVGRASAASPSAGASAGQARRRRSAPSTIRASGPPSPDANASSRYGCTLRTARAECTAPANDDDDAARAAARRDGDRVGEVLRAVGLQRRRRPHRRGQHDRLGRREHALQEVRGLLERVGAVGDDDAADLGARQVVRDALGERRQIAKSMSLLSTCATCSLSSDDAGRRRRRAASSCADADRAGA